MAEGLRALGHDVTTVVERPNRFYPAFEYDLVWKETARRPARVRGLLRRLRALPRLIRDHDSFIFYFGSTLAPRMLDVPLLALFRKRISFVFLGSDVRHWEATEQHREQVGLRSYEGYRDRSPRTAVRTLRVAELFADVNYLQPSYAEAALAPYQHAWLAIDPATYTRRVSTADVPVVVHAPSNRSLKGTAEILASLDALAAEGVPFELRLIEAAPNDAVIDLLADADVVADELNEANYGMLALEGLASGCVVLAGNRVDVVPLPPDRPVRHICPENLTDVLRDALTSRADATHHADAGIEFVRQHHDRVEVARRLVEDLDTARTRTGWDYRPVFFARCYSPTHVRASLWEQLLTRLVVRRWKFDRDEVRSLRRRNLCL